MASDIKVKCSIPCPDCNGEGKDAEGQPCWTCHNRKRVTREIPIGELKQFLTADEVPPGT
jgi:DnaJ-class molecular chaperone